MTEAMGKASSFVWDYFTRFGKESSSCNLCRKILDCKHGTKGMISHLRAIHSITDPKGAVRHDPTIPDVVMADDEQAERNSEAIAVAPPAEAAADTSDKGASSENRKRNSFVWQYFQPEGPTSGRCNICAKLLDRKHGTKGMIVHLKGIHGIDRQTMDLHPETKNPRTSFAPFATDDSSTDYNPAPVSPKGGSFVWKYFWKVGASKARCNLCEKMLQTKSGTKGLFYHLRTAHEIRQIGPVEQRMIDLAAAPRVSFVWKYFTKLSGCKARCLKCQKQLSRKGGNKALRYHLMTHGIKERRSTELESDDYSSQEVYIKQEAFEDEEPCVQFPVESCYVCSTELGSDRKFLNDTSSFTKTMLYQMLGKP